jgi:Fe-S-cluster-containing dehydrogenase component
MSRVSGECKTTFDTRLCTGCATCEMACSYHHSGCFQPSISSIEVTGNPKEGFKISFYASPQDGHVACDGCRGLEEPLCLTFCSAVARSELEELIGRSSGSRNR